MAVGLAVTNQTIAVFGFCGLDITWSSALSIRKARANKLILTPPSRPHKAIARENEHTEHDRGGLAPAPLDPYRTACRRRGLLRMALCRLRAHISTTFLSRGRPGA